MKPPLEGLILQSYGTGTAQKNQEFISIIKEAVSRGLVIVIVTQCVSGTVNLQQYETGEVLATVRDFYCDDF